MTETTEPLDGILNQVIHADALTELPSFPAALVDTIVTSPPYYRQRDYRGKDQLGLEQTPEAYIAKLVAVFRECRRVLKASGSLWLVIGDKYVDGQQLGMPWRVALALKADGWILRSDIIWHKPNAMPSAVKTRPTTDHEYVFFFTRSPDYYYDADAIREPHVTFTEKSRMRGGRNHFFRQGGTPEQGKNQGNPNLHQGRWDQAFHPKGRNKRTVWSIPLSKFREVALRRLSRIAGRNVPPRWLSRKRRGAGPVPGQRYHRGSGPATGPQVYRHRLRRRILPNGPPPPGRRTGPALLTATQRGARGARLAPATRSPMGRG